MKKIYDANGETKRGLVEIENAFKGSDLTSEGNTVEIDDMIILTKIDYNKDLLLNRVVNTSWTINGLKFPYDENQDQIIIIDFLESHIENDKIINLSPENLKFKNPIKLSDDSKILIPITLYNSLREDEKAFIDNYDKETRGIRFYEGDYDLAIKMLFKDLKYVYLDIQDDKYFTNDMGYLEKYIKLLEAKQNKLRKEIKSNKKIIVGYKRYKYKVFKGNIPNIGKNYKVISGKTKEVEGSISIDENTYATTDIGRVRSNQEDAVLLIKDNDNKDFKMVIVADGMGGRKFGEVASNTIVMKLKNWFENLTKEQKDCFYTGIKGLEEDLLDEIQLKLQPSVEYDTMHGGASTLVCALVGKNDTMVVNVGDSRAYKTNKNKIIQISREDTKTQEKIDKGLIPTKDAGRFDINSNYLNQSIGMDRNELIRPHVTILDNKEYDMLLLFTDGVTDCLSDEDIAVVCRTTNKKELTNKIVGKAIKNDSILEDEYCINNHLYSYISGGKDNLTAAAIINNDDELEI